MAAETKDKWDKADVILKPLGGLLAALSVAVVGYLLNSALHKHQAIESNIRLYSELMSQREQAESALRKDMFTSIIDSFLAPNGAAPAPLGAVERDTGEIGELTGDRSLERKLLNLELLAYNFHESLNLQPLFLDLQKEIGRDTNPVERDEFSKRLKRVACDVAAKQAAVLKAEGVGEETPFTIILSDLEEPGETDESESGAVITQELEGVKRRFRVFVLDADADREEVKLRLVVQKWEEGEVQKQEEVQKQKEGKWIDEIAPTPFWVGPFDFPMIDNLRLPSNQRCAFVLNNFTKGVSADFSLISFPGSYASLKEKPYYQDIVRDLVASSKKMKQ